MKATWIFGEIKAEIDKDGTLILTGTGEIDFKEDFSPWFSCRDKIQKIVIGSGITSIKNNAFENCENLKSVIVVGETQISENVFSGCYNIDMITNNPATSVLIGKRGDCNIIYIGNKTAILTTENISSVDSKRKDIELDTLIIDYKPSSDDLFENYIDAILSIKPEEITTLVCRNDLLTANAPLFENLEEVYMTDNIKQIPPSSFRACYNLKKIIFPNDLEEIEHAAFFRCAALEEVVFPASLEKIGYMAFAHCTGIRKLTLNSDVILCKSAFSNCESIEEVIGSTYVSRIEANAFYKNKRLSTFKFGKNITAIRTSAFEGSGLKVLDMHETNIGRISPYAFKECKSLSKVIFPKVECDIEDFIFSGCQSLETLENTEFLKAIYGNAFKDCFNLTGPIKFGEHLNFTGHCIFTNCSKLNSVDMGNTKLTTIPSRTFYKCSSLDEVVFPKTLEHIQTSAFEETNLKKLDLTGTNIEIIAESAFKSCKKLETILMPDCLRRIDSYAFSDSPVKNIKMKESSVDIKDHAFNC